MVVRNKQRMPLSAYLCPAESDTCSSFEHCITDVDGNEDVKPLVGGIKGSSFDEIAKIHLF